ncbi:MAG: zinc-binding dehydrogenase [Actinobacteria bacterium]|nr:zinc-binding dehydrogenase [Actinomycetota bacterium]
MKAARFKVSTREFQLDEIPIPTPDAGQVRIEVMAAGVCLSDVHLLSGILTPAYLVGDEVTMGHEVAGFVEEIGPGVVDWVLGDRVIVCAGVRDSKNRVTTLGFDYDGGFAEYVVADVATLVRIPKDLPFEQACIIPDAVSTPWAAICQTGQVKKGEAVAVFGIGGLGVHAVQLLSVIGAEPVIAIDPLEQARARSLAVGADFALDPFDPDFSSKFRDATQGRGVNVAFDFVGSSVVRTQALKLLAEGGRLVIVGLANEQIVIPNDIAFAYKRTQILGHYGSEPLHTQEIVNLIADGKLDLSGSISSILPLEKITDAFHQLENKINNPIRIVIKPNSN